VVSCSCFVDEFDKCVVCLTTCNSLCVLKEDDRCCVNPILVCRHDAKSEVSMSMVDATSSGLGTQLLRCTVFPPKYSMCCADAMHV
jgi:hypothetical protein